MLPTLCLRQPCLRKEEERCCDWDAVWVRETYGVISAGIVGVSFVIHWYVLALGARAVQLRAHGSAAGERVARWRCR